MKQIASKVPMGEKVGYALGDAAANLVFQMMMIYQLKFYTDVFGLEGAVAGTVLLVARFVDAFIDPTAGILSDKTQTKWGKFRPWVVWTALPFMVFYVLAFYNPGIENKELVALYAGISYVLLMSLYSFNNTPYSSLGGVMTSDIKERTSITSIRFVAATLAQFVVQGLTLPLVSKFGRGAGYDDAHGWLVTVSLFAVLGFVFLIVAGLSAKERIAPPAAQKSDVKNDLKGLLANVSWRSMFVLTLFVFITLAMWGSAMCYYFQNYVDPMALASFLERWGLVRHEGEVIGGLTGVLDSFGLIAYKPINDSGLQAYYSQIYSIGLSLFNMVGAIVQLIGVMTLSNYLAGKFGKKSTFLVCLTLTAVFTAMFYFPAGTDIDTIFILGILKSLAYAPTVPLLWAMIADVADNIEFTTHRRATGLCFSGIVFALKAGLGVGGAIAGVILSAFGYASDVAGQDSDALLGIRLASSWVPAVCFMVGVVALVFYPISKKFNEKMQQALAERKQNELRAGAGTLALVLLFLSGTMTVMAQERLPLKDAFAGKFLMGVALSDKQVKSGDERLHSLVKQEFNSVVAENCMKAEILQPEEGKFDFEAADRFIALAERNGQEVTGHCLVWHSQAPYWFFRTPEGGAPDRETMIERMRNHIYTVVGRYRGRVKGWDVVNEAIESDGTLRRSPLYNIIGEDFITLAFRFAHEADPDAELYYNDYSMDAPKKREAVCGLVRKLKEEGCRIDAVGMQSHVSFDTPLDEYETSIKTFAAEGVKVMVTELDLSVLPWPKGNFGAAVETNFEYSAEMNPFPNGLSKKMEKKQTDFYCKLFDIYKRNAESISRVCFWGVSDGDSWKNDWPMVGRTDYPLAFDRNLNPKPFVNILTKKK